MSDVYDLTVRVGRETRELAHSEDPTIILLFLMEELGEVARAYLKEGGHKAGNDRVTGTFPAGNGRCVSAAPPIGSRYQYEFGRMLEKTENKLRNTSGK